MAAYGVNNAALVALTRVLDIDLRPHGMRVNAVAPQQLDTRPTGPYSRPRRWRTRSRRAAIADVIAFLVSDAAAPVSGAILPAYGA